MRKKKRSIDFFTAFMVRFAMGMQSRADMWQILADILTSGIALDEALDAIREGAVRTGKKYEARFASEMIAGNVDGDLGNRISAFTIGPETLILSSIGQQDPQMIFASAARLLRNKLSIRKAMMDAIAMPILLILSVIGLILFFGLQLFPALEEIVDFDALVGFQYYIVQGTLAFSANPYITGVVLVCFVVVMILITKYWTGYGRQYLDRIPPFSILRVQSGMSFLFAVVEYGRMNVAVTTALLDDIAKMSGRYEASRIKALAKKLSVSQSGNMGEASLHAKLGYPPEDIAVVMRILWNRPDGIRNVGNFISLRLERFEETMKASMAVLNIILMVLVTVILLSLMSIALPLVDQINSGAM